MNMEFYRKLPTPKELKEEFPASDKIQKIKAERDAEIRAIFEGKIEDIKKNNDYAMWLKVCCKADCYLLDETLGQYRKGRVGSVSTHSIKTMIGWHYKLYHEAEHMGKIESLFNTGRNLIFGFYKKKRYVKK